MKKSHMIAVSCLLATSLVTGTAAAQSDKYKESGKNTEASEKYEKKEKEKQLGGVSEKDAALWAAAGILEKDGNLTDAASMGKEALRANYKDIEAYKKLGLLYKKLGKQNLGLYVNGEELEAAPILHNGRTLVPFRSISEALEAEVNWNPADKSVTVTRGGVVVKLIIDNKIAYVNGKEKVLDIPATLVEGTTVVPSRFVSEALNAEVQWEPETGAVIIIDKEATENTEASAATEASADAQ